MHTWPRRTHFDFYRTFDDPHFSVCADVDLTTFRPAIKERGTPVTVAIVYVLARAANAIPELRQRIRGDQVVEHEVVHPSITILSDDDLFSFCLFDYSADFATFAHGATERIALVQSNPILSNEPGQDNLLFMTAIPWISFTSFTHPTLSHRSDSVPRIAWGKFFSDGAALRMPLQVEVHHALMDGLHVGRFYEQVQTLLDHPDFLSALAGADTSGDRGKLGLSGSAPLSGH
jgi:chloramphenicol O-acetyltransferase type A